MRLDAVLAILKTTTIFSLQNSLDAVVPRLLPLLVTALVFYALRNRGWLLGRTVLARLVVDIVLAYLGILG